MDSKAIHALYSVKGPKNKKVRFPKKKATSTPTQEVEE